MSTKTKVLFFVLFVFSIVFLTKGIISYFTSTRDLSNAFKLEYKTVTYEYYSIDENGNSTQLQAPRTENVFPGTVINLVGDHALANDPNYLLKFEIDGVQTSSNSYTVQNNNVTITQKYYRKTFTVIFDSNGGSGTMNNQLFLFNVQQALTQNAFTNSSVFIGWNTSRDGTGTPYADQEQVMNLCANHGDTITLYAQWQPPEATITYYFGDDIEFDGTQHINTDIALFSSDYIDNRIEVSATIDSFTILSGQNNGINTVFSDMNTPSPYYGFSFRYKRANNQDVYNFVRNCNPSSTGGIDYYPTSTTERFRFVRENHKLYADINNTGTLTESGDYSNLAGPFDVPLVFGASLDGHNLPFRYLKGQLSDIIVKTTIDATQMPITLPTPTRTGYIFKGWYSDSNFTTRIGMGGAQYIPSGDITLYAKWKAESSVQNYEYNGPYVFDGTNYIDTDICLYSEDNIENNFLISFNIDSIGNNSDGSTLCGEVDATKSSLPGHIIRFDNGSIQIESNSNTSIAGDVVIPSGTTNVRIARVANKLYYSFDGQNFTQINNYTGFTDTHDIPVTFGASLDEHDNPDNYFVGTLSDMLVKILPDTTTLTDLNNMKVLKTMYQHSGAMTFNGSSDYIDTGLQLFTSTNINKDFEVSFNLDRIDSGYVNQATIVNCKNEGSTNYPGFVYRLYTAGTVKFEARGGTGSGVSNSQASVQHVKIARKGSKMYVTINHGTETEAYDFSTLTEYFNRPLTIGSSLGSDGTPFRYFKGQLSDIVVKVDVNYVEEE